MQTLQQLADYCFMNGYPSTQFMMTIIGHEDCKVVLKNPNRHCYYPAEEPELLDLIKQLGYEHSKFGFMKNEGVTPLKDQEAINKRFVNYCWRLGFTPKECKFDHSAFYVTTDTRIGESIFGSFTNWFYDQDVLWCRLSFADIHNDAIMENWHGTKNWFAGYEAPKTGGTSGTIKI